MSNLEAMERRLAQLQNQIKKEKARQSQENRKAEAHAKIVLGGMLLAHLGVDWKELDFEKVALKLKENEGQFAGCECVGLPIDQAKKRLRHWERGNAWGSYDPEAGTDSKSTTVDSVAETPRHDAGHEVAVRNDQLY